MENIISFIAVQDGRTTLVSCSADASWTELADNFLDFLRGAGFSVEAKDLAEYFEGKTL